MCLTPSAPIKPWIAQGIVDILDENSKKDVIEQIQLCVRIYSPGKTALEYFTYLINRICNAVKAIFGRSDFQLAKKAITSILLTSREDTLNNEIKKKSLIITDVDKSYFNLLRETSEKSCSGMADGLLTAIPAGHFFLGNKKLIS